MGGSTAIKESNKNMSPFKKPLFNSHNHLITEDNEKKRADLSMRLQPGSFLSRHNRFDVCCNASWQGAATWMRENI